MLSAVSAFTRNRCKRCTRLDRSQVRVFRSLRVTNLRRAWRFAPSARTRAPRAVPPRSPAAGCTAHVGC